MMANYLEWLRGLMPEVIVTITALAVIALDQFGWHHRPAALRWRVGSMVASLGCLGAILWMRQPLAPLNAMGGMLVIDPATQMLKAILLILTILTLLLSADCPFSRHPAEFILLLMLASLGLMFLISSEHLLMIFVSLELTSLSLYSLAALNNHERASAEASVKYFLFGGVATAFLLYGLSLIYGFTGETNLPSVAVALARRSDDPLVLTAMLMVVMGFGFKIAIAPFHLWAPDVYEGAPIPAAAFIASASKIASFFVIAKLMWVGFGTLPGAGGWRAFAPGWVPVLAVLALISMVWGNVAAITQNKVRRLLAYSAVAHAGYATLALLAGNRNGFAALLYYVITYAFTTLGAFSVVAMVNRRMGGDELRHFAGLGRRSPLLAICMMVFMLSLAGIPPLAGFFGKFYVFTAALKAGPKPLALLWLVLVALATSVVSFYYYLQVLKQIFVAPPDDHIPAWSPPPVTQVVLLLLTGLVVLLGVYPSLLIADLTPLDAFLVR
jgi:NADH-quinone oxidoreductase subunit N